jgi:hypothetical protein
MPARAGFYEKRKRFKREWNGDVTYIKIIILGGRDSESLDPKVRVELRRDTFVFK